MTTAAPEAESLDEVEETDDVLSVRTAPAEKAADKLPTPLGWCITGHHGWEPGVPVERGFCPGVTCGGKGYAPIECSCGCHRGEEVVRRQATIERTLDERLADLDDLEAFDEVEGS